MTRSPKQTDIRKLRVALVYDRVNKFGGAERVMLSLKKLFPKAPIYTLVANKRKARWASKFEIKPSFFNRFSWLRDRHEILAPVAPLGFESFKFDAFDLVISVTSTDAKGIITKPGTMHVCYCLTPTRYLWSLERDYKTRPGFGYLNFLVRPVFQLFKKFLQARDLVLASRPDAYIAISETVKRRLKKYYQRDSRVVYPGINPQFFVSRAKPPGNFYLLVSRLVPYKKADQAILAFNQLKLPLVVVGTGSEMTRLRKLARHNIRFVGQVSDTSLVNYYLRAKALVFPQEEDYGLVPLEAQACGTPVIAYKRGGAKETVVSGKTGILYSRQTASAIIRSIRAFEASKFEPHDCRTNAARFSQREWRQNFLAQINSLWQEYQLTQNKQ